MDKPSLLDWAIAPLTWLERAKGWKRLGLLLVYLLVTLVVGVLGWRELAVWGLPDVGEPFDVDRFGSVAIAEADDAMVLYHQAAKKLNVAGLGSYQPASLRAWDAADWATADPEVRRWVVDNRPAFADWLQATARPDSLLAQPRELTSDTSSLHRRSFQDFARLASLEASRLEAEGDLAGAWRLHRATLRSSRHVGMHGGSSQRNIGLVILNLARPGVGRWAENLQLPPELLRQAIADVETCRRMTSPASEKVRADYFVVRSVLDNLEGSETLRQGVPPSERPWYQQLTDLPEFQRFVAREPDRSRRVLNLVVAGELAQCDRPGSARPGRASPRYPIYEVDSETPTPLASIAPKDLAAWADRSLFGLIWGGTNGWSARLDAEPGIFDTLLLAMAQRAYAIEQGRPARTYGELVGRYLKALPDGIAAGDRIAPDPNP